MRSRLLNAVRVAAVAIVAFCMLACQSIREPKLGQLTGGQVSGSSAGAAATIVFKAPQARRQIKTILATAETYRLRIYLDSVGSYGTLLSDTTGDITPGTQNTITVDGLPAENLLDFKLEVKDAASNVVGQGLAQATLTSQAGANSVPMTMYAEMPGMPGTSGGDNGSVSVAYSGLVAEDSRTVAARLDLESGVDYQIEALVSGSGCTPSFSTVAGVEGSVLPGTGTTDTTGTFTLTGSGGYSDVRTAFTDCAGDLTFTVKATRQGSGYTTLGSFSSAGVSLVTAREEACAVATGGYVFVLGGYTGSSLGSVERAPINVDGSLGAFATVPGVSLVTQRFAHRCTVIGDKLYVIGGANSTSDVLDTIESATVGVDGGLGAFSTRTETLSTARYRSGFSIIGDKAYLLGGQFQGGGYSGTSTVQAATLGAGGTLSAFVSAGTMAVGRWAPTVQRIGSYLYVFGGSDSSGDETTSVERAPINPDSTLGTFESQAGALYYRRTDTSSVVVGSNIYVLGGVLGATTLGSAEKAAISGGALGAFVDDAEHALPSTKQGIATLVVGNRLFLLGGWRQGTGALSTIEQAIMN